MNYYYEIESLLNNLPQRSIAMQIQSLVYQLLTETQSPILEVEKYFRNVIKKIEQYYCRRLQKLEYFIEQGTKSEILHRVSKYQIKKPWAAISLDYRIVKPRKLNTMNCNQVIEVGEQDFQTSKTSTPFSHYSRIPSLQKDTSLNDAVYFDSQPSFLSEHDDLDIEELQAKLITFVDKKQGQDADIDELQNPSILEVSEIKATSDHNNDIPEFNPDFNEQLFDTSRIEQDQEPQIDDDLDNLFRTKQSTREILKYVEQYQSGESKQNQRVKSTSYHHQIESALLFDREQTPQQKKYRVRSSYQKELQINTRPVRLRSNISHETFDVKGSTQNKAKMVLPSPLNIKSPYSSIPVRKPKQQPRAQKRLLSYSLDKNGKLECEFKPKKRKLTIQF